MVVALVAAAAVRGELGAAVSELFADERARIRGIIEAQLRGALDRGEYLKKKDAVAFATPAFLPPLPEGVKLHKDLNIQGVWLADGFSFKGYQTLYLTPVVFAGVERDNEVDIRALAMQELPAELVTSLRDTKLFDTVATKSEDVKSKSKTLRLDNTIIEFSKGSGVGRHFGGPFGAGCVGQQDPGVRVGQYVAQLLVRERRIHADVR